MSEQWIRIDIQVKIDADKGKHHAREQVFDAVKEQLESKLNEFEYPPINVPEYTGRYCICGDC